NTRCRYSSVRFRHHLQQYCGRRRFWHESARILCLQEAQFSLRKYHLERAVSREGSVFSHAGAPSRLLHRQCGQDSRGDYHLAVSLRHSQLCVERACLHTGLCLQLWCHFGALHALSQCNQRQSSAHFQKVLNNGLS
ncbi:hypothetical protein PMAYCL1PPCAC_16650, partial [Pristionchus mayeri]